MDQKGLVQTLRGCEVSEQGAEESLNSSLSTRKLMILLLPFHFPLQHRAFEEGIQRNLNRPLSWHWLGSSLCPELQRALWESQATPGLKHLACSGNELFYLETFIRNCTLFDET